MKRTTREFDRFILRPLFAVYCVTAITLLVQAKWTLFGLSLIGCFYISMTGAKLHPDQTFDDLRSDPVDSPGAIEEESILSTVRQDYLLGIGSFNVGLVLGATTYLVLTEVHHLPFGTAGPSGIGIWLFIGTLLRSIFASK